ncbi:MAG: 4-alpha-glucanotransferase [Candidatus Hydrogenedentes bacterium]|nr:4-alpha-glucanotransferase [Candidatus Hydrogenedentota bacterium]
MRLTRSSGILLHPTSLPGRYGIGDFGAEAYRFIDFLQAAGQRVWQVLPLGPTGYGDSPYQCFSAFAGNPLMISPDRLAEDGLLDKQELTEPPAFPADRVDFGRVIGFKKDLIQKAGERFHASPDHPDQQAFAQFCLDENAWLSDYTLFMAMKHSNNWAPWNTWDEGITRRHEEALRYWGETLSAEIYILKFAQFQFFKQWSSLKAYANERGIRIMGDIPIYVAHDSADVWAHPDLFHLDDKGNPTVVAGVPPDYFSATGQLWGNPIYRWDLMAQRGYIWWTQRLRSTLKLVDLVRIDHFRGFESYWEVPATEQTAINGRWVAGPGDGLFHSLEHALGKLPIVAENLGVITDEVEALRHRHEFPGMAVLHFAFGTDAAHSGLLPHLWEADTVAYTGTADNDTTVGWWSEAGGSTQSKKDIRDARAYAKRYLNVTGKDIHWACIRILMASVADTVIFPLQDVLGLGSAARMNLPGSSGGSNWCWRVADNAVTSDMAAKLRELAEIYGRLLPEK